MTCVQWFGDNGDVEIFLTHTGDAGLEQCTTTGEHGLEQWKATGEHDLE